MGHVEGRQIFGVAFDGQGVRTEQAGRHGLVDVSLDGLGAEAGFAQTGEAVVRFQEQGEELGVLLGPNGLDLDDFHVRAPVSMARLSLLTVGLYWSPVSIGRRSASVDLGIGPGTAH